MHVEYAHIQSLPIEILPQWLETLHQEEETNTLLVRECTCAERMEAWKKRNLLVSETHTINADAPSCTSACSRPDCPG